jgi:hypothetical protein
MYFAFPSSLASAYSNMCWVWTPVTGFTKFSLWFTKLKPYLLVCISGAHPSATITLPFRHILSIIGSPNSSSQHNVSTSWSKARVYNTKRPLLPPPVMFGLVTKQGLIHLAYNTISSESYRISFKMQMPLKNEDHGGPCESCKLTSFVLRGLHSPEVNREDNKPQIRADFLKTGPLPDGCFILLTSSARTPKTILYFYLLRPDHLAITRAT